MPNGAELPPTMSRASTQYGSPHEPLSARNYAILRFYQQHHTEALYQQAVSQVFQSTICQYHQCLPAVCTAGALPSVAIAYTCTANTIITINVIGICLTMYVHIINAAVQNIEIST